MKAIKEAKLKIDKAPKLKEVKVPKTPAMLRTRVSRSGSSGKGSGGGKKGY